jgi:hypothetical protein
MSKLCWNLTKTIYHVRTDISNTESMKTACGQTVASTDRGTDTERGAYTDFGGTKIEGQHRNLPLSIYTDLELFERLKKESNQAG